MVSPEYQAQIETATYRPKTVDFESALPLPVYLPHFFLRCRRRSRLSRSPFWWKPVPCPGQRSIGDEKQQNGMENLNAPHELDRLKTKVLQQLQTLQGAPSVQMMEVGVRVCKFVCKCSTYWYCSVLR